MKTTISVMIFAFFGGILRASLANTLMVNLIGAFALAFLAEIFLKKEYPEWLVVGVKTGFLGAFTTFSSFTLEFITQQNWLYLFATIFGGFACAMCGFFLAQKVVVD
ncbi:MAG: CrcB family protein [Limosilactobacillus sp.]|uniref:fluoride efflux transporter FluC n=1 Tax=Limosilactobacillus sp. TaxID=2773925 RepID=UPI002703628B|nr:CrcB family protein [Limosilactobacillus sp.]